MVTVMKHSEDSQSAYRTPLATVSVGIIRYKGGKVPLLWRSTLSSSGCCRIQCFCFFLIWNMLPFGHFSSVQFSHSVLSHSLRPHESIPWIAACQASLSITNSQSLLKLMLGGSYSEDAGKQREEVARPPYSISRTHSHKYKMAVIIPATDHC